MPQATRGTAEAQLLHIRDAAASCTACSLHRERTRCVFGTGKADATLMFVGEAPGPDEDRTGEPFTGRSGQLLTRIVEAMGFSRGNVFLTNVVTCRLDEGRHLNQQQVNACRDHLEAQIRIVSPTVIVALGSTAWQWFQPGEKRPIGEVRGTVYRWRRRLIVPTYHPAFLLRKPDHKRYVWLDMQRAKNLLAGTSEEPDRVVDIGGEGPPASLF